MNAERKQPTPGTVFAQALEDYLVARADLDFDKFNPTDAPEIQAALRARRDLLIAAFDRATSAAGTSAASLSTWACSGAD